MKALLAALSTVCVCLAAAEPLAFRLAGSLADGARSQVAECDVRLPDVGDFCELPSFEGEPPCLSGVGCCMSADIHLPSPVFELPVLEPCEPVPLPNAQAALPSASWRIDPEALFQAGNRRSARDPLPHLVVRRDPHGIAPETADAVVRDMVYRGLADGTLPVRGPEWRPSLLGMLVKGAGRADFDHVFSLLLSSFPGHDEEARVAALLKWSAGLDDRDAADVWRALARRRIAAEMHDEAVAAVDVMVSLRPDYALRGMSLKAHAYAFSGDFPRSRECIGLARGMAPSRDERARLDFLEAWIMLQEGETASARRLLKRVSDSEFSSQYGRRARDILESIGEEGAR